MKFGKDNRMAQIKVVFKERQAISAEAFLPKALEECLLPLDIDEISEKFSTWAMQRIDL